MSLVYLAFANDQNAPLPSLREEEDQIYSFLIRRAQQGHFDVQKDSFATTRKIAEYLNLFKDELIVFHYSGHANQHSLFLEDGPAFAAGIGGLLGNCPKLKLIVLNGCATYGQLKHLRDLQNTPSIIYSEAPVGDESATLFSINFYRELVDRYQSLTSAFDSGIEAAKLIKEDISPLKSLALPTSNNANAPGKLWGISSKDSFNLEWSLPTKNQEQGKPDFLPNEFLLETLIHPLAKDHKEINLVLEKEKKRKSINILDRRQAILIAFPLPLSEQLRKLIVPQGEDAHEYYDQLGKSRFKQILTTYTTFLELLSFSLLAQLWEELSQNKIKPIDSKYQVLFKKLFKLNFEERISFNFLELVSAIIEIFQTNDVDFFFEELKNFESNNKPESSFWKSAEWLYSMNQKFNNGSSGQNLDGEIKQLCKDGEKYLANFIAQLCFMANYRILCVKDIGVLNYRHKKQAIFRHKVVRLIQRFVGLEEQYENRADYLDSASVLFVKENGQIKRKLNLTPFVIDHNAFDEKAPLTKLHYYDRYEKEYDAYSFKHVYKPEDLPLIIRSEDHFEVIKEQFNHFSELLFKQEVNQL